MVQRRNISYATQTTEGTKAWDTFMSLVATTRKLELVFLSMRDRISQIESSRLFCSNDWEKSSLNFLVGPCQNNYYPN